MNLDEIQCQATEGCKGHALLPGGELLIIDGKRHCWNCGAKAKKQKDKCVRIPIVELQTALDLLNKGIDSIIKDNPGASGGFTGPMPFVMARQILHELLEEKGVTDA